jgi:predicted DNA-binding transcriptional regulator AlpA
MPKTPAAVPNTPNTDSTERFLTGPQVCARYGIVQMSLWRWLKDEDYADLEFPQPAFRVRDRRFWREADLVRWERRSAPARHRAKA